MAKVAVKLANPDNRLYHEDGKTVFTPYDVHVVEETEYVKKCIEVNALERIRDHKIEEETPSEILLVPEVKIETEKSGTETETPPPTPSNKNRNQNR